MRNERKIRKILAAAVFAAGLAAAPAMAAECGVTPQQDFQVPDGETATRDQMTAAINALRAYGEAVNSYLDCLDANQETQFFNMTVEQQERWIEDYNALAENLSQVQNLLNEQIRIFNARATGGGDIENSSPPEDNTR